MVEWQNTQPSDRVSRLMVHRGMEMDSGLSVDSSITFSIGTTMGNLKPLFLWQPRLWYAINRL